MLNDYKQLEEKYFQAKNLIKEFENRYVKKRSSLTNIIIFHSNFKETN